MWYERIHRTGHGEPDTWDDAIKRLDILFDYGYGNYETQAFLLTVCYA